MGSSVDWCRRVGQSITHPFIHSFIQSIGPPSSVLRPRTNRDKQAWNVDPFLPPLRSRPNNARSRPCVLPCHPHPALLRLSLCPRPRRRAGQADQARHSPGPHPTVQPPSIHPSILVSPLTIADGAERALAAHARKGQTRAVVPGLAPLLPLAKIHPPTLAARNQTLPVVNQQRHLRGADACWLGAPGAGQAGRQAGRQAQARLSQGTLGQVPSPPRYRAALVRATGCILVLPTCPAWRDGGHLNDALGPRAPHHRRRSASRPPWPAEAPFERGRAPGFASLGEE